MNYRDEFINRSPCDLNCPPAFAFMPMRFARCCVKCNEQRKVFAANGGYNCFSKQEKQAVKDVWSEKDGFASERGCKLPRNLMPTECLEYDCKRYDYQVVFRYREGRWQATHKRGKFFIGEEEEQWR